MMFWRDQRDVRAEVREGLRHLEKMSNKGQFKLEAQTVATLLLLAVGAVYAFARIELQMAGNNSRITAMEQSRFSTSDWERSQAVLNSEMRGLDQGLQRLCQELVHYANQEGHPISLDCPITIRQDERGNP